MRYEHNGVVREFNGSISENQIVRFNNTHYKYVKDVESGKMFFREFPFSPPEKQRTNKYNGIIVTARNKRTILAQFTIRERNTLLEQIESPEEGDIIIATKLGADIAKKVVAVEQKHLKAFLRGDDFFSYKKERYSVKRFIDLKTEEIEK